MTDLSLTGGAALLRALLPERPPCVFGSVGGNLVPGVAIARANSPPLLLVTSNNQHAASYPDRGMFA